jgi:lysyl-tRNA synthetase
MSTDVTETTQDPPPERASFQETERQHRLDKLDALRARSIEPYPVRFDRDTTAAALHERHADLPAGTDTGEAVKLAGRVMALRRHGGLDFADLRDQTGAIQLMADRERLGGEELTDFSHLDLGDWVGATGTVVTTDTGELSVALTSFQLLSKALRPLPDVRHGLADPEARYRQRYLDLTVNEHSRRVFAIRSTAITSVRQTLIDRGFHEVETPVLLSQAGGAAAKPFVTHHNALDIDMTLRIALELPLKRLIVGGMDRVFEIGRVFRNEGIDTRHNPEFTELEAYQAFGDYHDMMDLTEAIIVNSAKAALGTTLIKVKGQEVDFSKPFRRATMAELIKENAGVDMHPSMPVEEARKIADQLGVEWLDVWGSGKIMSECYDESSEDKLIEPTFVMDHPRETSPLARVHRSDPFLVERFELVVAGRELANAYSELNDPVDQAQRFRDEAKLQAGGDEEAEPVDDDYVMALEYGLPPTGGLGVGIDRLVMLLAEAEAIRDVILFPTLRPLDGAPATHAAPAHAATPAARTAAPAAAAAADDETEDDAAELVAAPAPALRAPTRRPASLATLSWLTALFGLLSLLPTVPLVDWSFGIGTLLDRPSRAVTFVISVVIGVGLLAVARQLYLGRRSAWALAIALFALAAAVHLVKGPDPIPLLIDIAMLFALVWYRQDFHGRSDPGSLGDVLIFIPLYLAVVLIFGFVSLLTQANHVTPRLGVGGGLETVFGGLVGVDGPYRYRQDLFGDFFPDALLALGIAGAAILLYLLLRPLVQSTPEDETARVKARRIVEQYGSDTLAYFALRHDKSYFFSSDGRSLIAYAYVRGHAMVAADPIGPPQDTARTLDEFLAFCRERGWSTAFLAVRESDAELYRDRGLHVLYLGDEAILHCEGFSLGGRKMKAVREAVNRVARDHTFELLHEDEASPELVAQLNEISEMWRKGAPERGFTMELGEDVVGELHDFVLAVARGADGTPAGFLRFVPAYSADDMGYSLDLMRRKPDSVNGLTEYLIANAALALGEQGVKRLSLNFAAWGRLLDSAGDAGLGGRIQRAVARGLNPFFQIQSLRDFNQKFDPEWLPRSMVVDDVGDLPKVALLYASVEGFLDVPVVGKLLVPPVRQKAQSGAAPTPAG